MNPVGHFLVWPLLLAMSGCLELDVATRHHHAVANGYKKVPIAESMRKTFGAWSYITHWNIPNDPKYGFEKFEKKWGTQAYLYGRYDLGLVQPVILSKNGGEVVRTKGSAKLSIFEISRIYGDPVAPSTDYSDFQPIVEGKDLERLVESGWDFSAIGLELKKEQPHDEIGWLYNYWNRIYPLQPQRPRKTGGQLPNQELQDEARPR